MSRSRSDPVGSSRNIAPRAYGVGWKQLRRRVLAEEPFCVGYPLGEHAGDPRVPATSVDHIKPLSEGGTDDRANLRGLCGPCNSRTGRRRTWRDS